MPMKKEKKKIISDLIYCIGAIGLMNVVLQFVVYPLINYQLGEAAFGDMLFWLGIVSILAPSFGLAVNNTRLVFPERWRTGNGDYIIVIFVFSGISALIVLVLCAIQNTGIMSAACLVYIIIISVFRNYSTVEYRLNLNYKKQLVFYVILSIGYVAGVFVCSFTSSWFDVFIIGETLAMLYVIFTGSIYQVSIGTTPYKKKIGKHCFTLAEAYILTNLMLNLDRLVLKYGIGSEAVSQYYVLSLLGKTIAIIGGPLSSVIISYISKENYRLNRKEFGKIVIAMLGVGSVFLIVASAITPIYIKILYSNLYNGIQGLNIIVNIAQIFYFLTTLLLVIVLTICDAKWQLRIQMGYSILFVVMAIIFTMTNGLRGFAVAAGISNASYFFLTVIIGFKFADDSTVSREK